MKITVIQTGSTLVSGAVPDRSSHKWKYAYTGLFQKLKSLLFFDFRYHYVKVCVRR